MPPEASVTPDPETEDNLFLARSFIGSTPFKIIVGVVLTGFLGLMMLGMTASIDKEIDSHPTIQNNQKAIAALNQSVSQHTSQLNEIERRIAEEQASQQHIYEAIKSVSNDVHALDVHISAVDQSVRDVKDQVNARR